MTELTFKLTSLLGHDCVSGQVKHTITLQHKAIIMIHSPSVAGRERERERERDGLREERGSWSSLQVATQSN